MVAAPIHAMIWKTAWLEENNLSSKNCSVDKPKRKRNKAAEAAEGSKIFGVGVGGHSATSSRWGTVTGVASIKNCTGSKHNID